MSLNVLSCACEESKKGKMNGGVWGEYRMVKGKAGNIKSTDKKVKPHRGKLDGDCTMWKFQSKVGRFNENY